jgi:hypothetical protein
MEVMMKYPCIVVDKGNRHYWAVTEVGDDVMCLRRKEHPVEEGFPVMGPLHTFTIPIHELKHSHVTRDVVMSELRTCAGKHNNTGGCSWGKCDQCGVPNMLLKLHTGHVDERLLSPMDVMVMIKEHIQLLLKKRDSNEGNQ